MEHKNTEHQLSTAENDPNPAEVARRAYELYEARGTEPGHDLEDWLKAEAEVNQHGQVAQRD